MPLRWGILATGRIAKSFAKGVRESETGKLVAVGSRSIESATEFSTEFGGKPYGSYNAVLQDPEVDAVYIAAPNHLHQEWTIKAAEEGKHVLCEKPFTLNAPEAERALAAVNSAGVKFMEAFMYRCHPQTQRIKAILRSGRIGEPQMLNVEFGFAAPTSWQDIRAVNAYGGGALMDVGCYCVSFARMITEASPARVSYSAKLNDEPYDEVGVGTMTYDTGFTAHFGTAVHLQLANAAVVYGTEGRLAISSPWMCEGPLRIYKLGQEEPTEVISKLGEKGLYAYEADAFAKVVEGGTPPMPVEETLDNMRSLDRLRRSAGLSFSGEQLNVLKPHSEVEARRD